MIIPIEALPKVILISTIVAELFLVAIPLILILAYRQKNSLAIRSLWLGMGLAVVTCVKFIFLMKQQLFSNWEPVYSVFIILVVEVLVREWIVRRWHKWESRPVGIQFIMGYLFAKLLGIGTSIFLFFTWMLARLSYKGDQGTLNTEAFQQLTPYTALILHSLFNLGYMLLLLVFILLRVRLLGRSRRLITLTEFGFLLFQGILLITINTPTLPTIPTLIVVTAGTIGLGYLSNLLIHEPAEKHPVIS